MLANLNWVQLAWPMMAAICLALAGLYFAVWLRRRDRREFLMFAGAALSIATVAGFEFSIMQASTAERAVEALRWVHLPLGFTGAFFAGFACHHFGGMRKGLFAGLVIARALVFGLALALPFGVNFQSVSGLKRIELPGGATVHGIEGIASPWTALASGSWLFLIALVADAAYTAWRRGPAQDRPRIARLGGAMLVFFVGSATHTLLVHVGALNGPYFVTPAFFLVNLAMAAELIGDIVRASKLADSLRASEARLRESETERELAADAVGFAHWSLDGASREFQASKRFGALFGFGSEPPYTLLAVVERVHSADRDRLRWEIDAALSSGRPVAIEVQVIAAGDRPRWVRCVGRPDRSAIDRPTLRGICHEVTDLRLAEERFRAIVESAPSALIIVDPAGRIVFGNQLAVELLGYTRAELDGLTLEELLPERLRSAHADHRDRFMEGATRRLMGVGLDLVGRRKDGTEFPIEVSLAPLPTEDGELAVAMFTDTTKRRELELSAARQRAELSHLSRVAVLGELSASLAHEINQPLAAILSNAEAAQRYLERDPVDVRELREIIGDIMADDVRAGEVIRRLRAMLRKEELPRVPLSMNDVVRDVLAIMHSDLVNRGVAVESELAKDLPAVDGDEVQLQQVLLNLIVNACDAMSASASQRILTVRTCREGAEVWTSIGDLGGGIPEADLERIFQPFVTSKPHGTGLGLSVCRTIVSLHEGRIWARNNPAGGATVTVALLAAGAPPE